AIGGAVTPSFVGALLAAVVVTMLVRRTSKPGFAIVNGALIGLVPGMRVYNGLLQMVGTNVVPADPSQGASALMVAAGVALALAAGASLGIYIGRPVGDRIMRLPQTWIRRLAF
ncbi:MAG: threonine/serine exporter family protein, partial [Propionibacteriaceae bacterium]|nr:threonine/serine exporter family protein [Propionibacteriaceae bacterium]